MSRSGRSLRASGGHHRPSLRTESPSRPRQQAPSEAAKEQDLWANGRPHQGPRKSVSKRCQNFRYRVRLSPTPRGQMCERERRQQAEVDRLTALVKTPPVDDVMFAAHRLTVIARVAMSEHHHRGPCQLTETGRRIRPRRIVLRVPARFVHPPARLRR